jgi:hypothetical protein
MISIERCKAFEEAVLSGDMDAIDAVINDEAAIFASELVGPNDPEYDAVVERQVERLWEMVLLGIECAE